MLANFVSWWLARITELLPSSWRSDAARPRDGLVVEVAANNDIIARLRRRGTQQPVSLGAAARLAGAQSVFLRPPANTVLVKHHIVPAAPRRHMMQMLYHELGRITPFPADGLFWTWDGQAKAGDTSRTDVTLTMIPRTALADVLGRLEKIGLKAHFIEVGPAERIRLLPVGTENNRAAGTRLVRGLSWACAGLAIVAVVLPIILQALALHRTEAGIAALQPAIDQVGALRRGIASGAAGQVALAQEAEKTGNVLQILATVTRLLPDDTYLTDFGLRERQLTLSGRSASAPRLITSLSAAPDIQDTAFAAPVTRIEGATADVFSIKARAAQ